VLGLLLSAIDSTFAEACDSMAEVTARVPVTLLQQSVVTSRTEASTSVREDITPTGDTVRKYSL
jgi:hypothetical protein